MNEKRLRDSLVYYPISGVFRWKITQGKAKAGCVAGVIGRNGYIAIGLDRRSYLAHRLAWFFMHNNWPEEHIDHINGIRTDNRICNLRAVTQAQNNRNTSLRKDNVIGVKGVRFVANRYRAQIRCNGVKYYLGRFRSLNEAANAYKIKAEELFGEFARKENVA